jgi:HK97 family phage portal protein
VQLFGRTRAAVDAANILNASRLSDAVDLYESMWQPPAPAYTVGTGDIPGLINGAYGLGTALMVPAFARGLNVICGVASSLPLVDLDPRTGTRMQPYALTAQDAMWPGRVNSELVRVTVTDLVAYGEAYWRVLRRNGLGHPEAVEPVGWDRVTTSVEIGVFLIDGDRVWVDTDGQLHDNDVIRFGTGAPGALDHGWLALRTALSLETAAHNYATSPLPSSALKSVLGADLDPDEAKDLLRTWEQARRTRSTAYLNSQVDIQTFGWNAAEMQLVEARQHAAIEVARALNLDPYWVGATQAGSSVTYSNRQDLYTGLLDFTVMPLLRAVEQRLSLPDVSGGNRQIRFDTTGFLRANLGDRVDALTAYVAAGVITPQQAADMEPMIQRGEVPL